MKKVFIIALLTVLGYSVASQAQLNTFTTYQLAFRKGNQVITVQPDLQSIKTTASLHEGANALSQQFIFKRQSNQGFMIASSAAPHQFLKRVGNEVVLTTYDPSREADYLWIIHVVKIDIVTTNEGERLTALMTTPDDANQALTLQADGLLKMATVDYSIADDPHRLYVIRKLVPGKF